MILLTLVDNCLVYERTSRATIQMKIVHNDILVARLIMPYKVCSLSIKA